jgi:hypothetical protein
MVTVIVGEVVRYTRFRLRNDIGRPESASPVARGPEVGMSDVRR